ncbi:MAG: hypothetical protein KAH33_06580 [Candidatus Delongbacteria bacterium]|nr:hypothetical protein [Candidatus Delongbacteria bacterium]
MKKNNHEKHEKRRNKDCNHRELRDHRGIIGAIIFRRDKTFLTAGFNLWRQHLDTWIKSEYGSGT